jgi:hypothetical protein
VGVATISVMSVGKVVSSRKWTKQLGRQLLKVRAAPMWEEVMAKGQMKGNKEAKKPKADKNQPKAKVSAYKQSQSKGGQAVTPFTKKP